MFHKWLNYREKDSFGRIKIQMQHSKWGKKQGNKAYDCTLIQHNKPILRSHDH